MYECALYFGLIPQPVINIRNFKIHGICVNYVYVCMHGCMYICMHISMCKMTFSSGVVNSCGGKCSSKVCVKTIFWFLFNFLLHV
jgi:hypothetical protein